MMSVLVQSRRSLRPGCRGGWVRRGRFCVFACEKIRLDGCCNRTITISRLVIHLGSVEEKYAMVCDSHYVQFFPFFSDARIASLGTWKRII